MGLSQDGALGQIAQDAVVLYLAKGDKSRRNPVAYGCDDTGDGIQLLLVFGVVPVADTVGKEFMIIL